MRGSRPLLYVLAIVWLAGCATARGPAFRPAENVKAGDGVVYVYREEGFAAGARPAYFYVNDVNVFNLNTGGYSWVALPPGRHKLRQEWSWDMLAKPIEMDILVYPGGQTRYISLKTSLCESWQKNCLKFQLHEETPVSGAREVATKVFEENFGLAKMTAQLPKP